MIEKFDTEISNFKNNEALREAVKELMDDCRQHARWLCDVERDEEGNRITDENGDYIYKEPDKDSYNYKLMESYLNLAKILAKTV